MIKGLIPASRQEKMEKNDKIKAKYYKNAEFGKKRIEYIKYFTNSPLTENQNQSSIMCNITITRTNNK